MRRDDRGQSIQIGAVLLFGALIIALSGYQAFVVPQQNERVEFSHSQTVQNQLQDVRNAVVSATGDASRRSVSVQLGTRYPSRIVAMNPGPPTGSLRTARSGGTGNPALSFEIVNARAAGETGDFWNGADVRNYPTRTVVYRPNYNVYGGAPTTRYEHSVLYNEFPSGTVPLAGQTFVDGNRISLVALNGSLSRTRTGATSVDVRPVSASTTTVRVTNPDPSSPVTLRLPTRLSRETWLALLDDQLNGPDGHVASVDVTEVSGSPYDTLAVTMEAGQNYTLQLAKAGVGTGVADTEEKYLTGMAGNGSAVPEAGSQLLVVQVRDAYNNPVADVEVAGDPEFGSLEESTVRTRADGRAVFTYDAPNVSTETADPIAFSYRGDPGGSFDADRPEDAELFVDVQDTRVEATTGTSDAPYTLVWQSPATDTTVDVGADGETLTLRSFVEDPTVVNETAVEGSTVDFSLNDSSIGTLPKSNPPTDENGEASTTFTAEANGTVRIYAVSGGASDVINVTVTNVSSDPGPPGPRAYDDDDGDGEWDSDEETYSKSALEGGFQEQADLVVPSDVGELDPGGDAIRATSLDVDVDVVSSGQVDLEATQAGGGTVDLNGNRVEAESGSVDVQGQEIRATDADILASGQVRLSATTSGGGPVVFDGATIEGSSIDVRSTRMSGENADLDAVGSSITLRATDSGGGPADLAGAQVTASANIDVRARGDVDVGDSVDQQARLETPGGSITASVQGGGVFSFDGVEIVDADDAASVTPDSAIDNSDTTESGSVT